MSKRFQKRPPDAIVVAVDFAKDLNPGETVVASNSRGALARTIKDAAGVDVTGTLSEGSPGIVGTAQVAFWLLAGVVGQVYEIEIQAPTSDNELLTDVKMLEILR